MEKPIKHSEFDIKNLFFTDLEDNPRINTQKIAYIKYLTSTDSDNSVLRIKSPVFEYDNYGIPNEGQFYPTARSRAFFKLGFTEDRLNPDIDYDEIAKFKTCLVSIDNFCDTDDFRKRMFGEKNYDKYKYQPLVRSPEVSEDATLKQKPQYTKIKLGIKYRTDNVPDFPVFVKKDDMRIKAVINTFDDVIKLLKFKSQIRFVIKFSKLYCMKTAVGKEKKAYGIIIKAEAVEVKPREEKLNTINDNEDDIFSDDVIPISSRDKPKLIRRISIIGHGSN